MLLILVQWENLNHSIQEVIRMLCEKCHTEMIAMNEDNVGGVICPKCGWNIVATKINDIMLDTKMYQLYALKNENINMSQIRILSKISILFVLNEMLLKIKCLL